MKFKSINIYHCCLFFYIHTETELECDKKWFEVDTEYDDNAEDIPLVKKMKMQEKSLISTMKVCCGSLMPDLCCAFTNDVVINSENYFFSS